MIASGRFSLILFIVPIVWFNLSVADIKPYANNPRKNDQAVDKVLESIEKFGFQQPIVVDKDNVIKAVKEGTLIRLPCQACGVKKVMGHHPDYTKPLEVIWLCREHHVEEHVRMRCDS